MEVYVITTEIYYPYNDRISFSVDSIHKTEKSRDDRLAEIQSDNKNHFNRVDVDWEKFTLID